MNDRPRTLLVGWDAADWKVLNVLIDRGEMPVFNSLVNRGVIADMTTLEPALSPMLWNSIATGKHADQHGILGFTEIDPASGRVRPVTSTSRRAKALWNILSQNDIRTNVAGWFGSHPAEPIRGICVSDAYARGFPAGDAPWPMLPETVWPVSIAPELERLRVRPEEIDPEVLRLFIPRLEEASRATPNLLPSLARVLAECFTTHAAATWAMENGAWDFMAVYYIGIDHFSHTFMNFHPPKPAWVDEAAFELYKEVVSAGYRLMDLFLSRLVQLAGPETNVVLLSDHGFHSDHLRPARIPRIPTGPATQHRPLGILAMAGPDIKRDERIYGVNLLDVAPTVLALFGLPAGRDMPGRVLTAAFERIPPLDRIDSWDHMPGDSGSHPPGYNPPSQDYDRLIEQFIALGYISPQPEDRDLAAAESKRESKWNLARVYIGTWRFEEALPLLEELLEQSPERQDFALSLADCRLRLGLLDEAEAAVAEARETEGARPENATPLAHFIRGKIAFEKHDYRKALDCFTAARQAEPRRAEVVIEIGLALARLRRWRDAERTFERALEIDPHAAIAHQSMARIRLRQNRPADAADCALTSIACRHDLPLSHFWLGVALVRMGERQRAIQAFETSLSFHPPLRIAHRMLAALHGATPEGRKHRLEARRFLLLRREELDRLEKTRELARRRARNRAPKAASPALEFIVVSGLPRSGTSLMMRILETAGLPPMTDGIRQADADNPGGYYEWEAIKTVGTHPEILLEARGRAIKVISMLLPALPPQHRYKVVFLDRPVEEVAASQFRMRRNRGGSERDVSLEKMPLERMAAMLGAHRSEILQGLRKAPRFDVLVVNYPDMVLAPDKWAARLQEFLGVEITPEAMRRVIRPELYRNRA